MALNGKLTSIHEVIENVYITTGYQSIDWAEALTHVGRAIALLGIADSLVDKITDDSSGNIPPILITNYRGDLPRDLVQLIQCREYTNKLPMFYSTDSFFLNPSNTSDYTPYTDGIDYTTFNGLTDEQLTEDPELRKYFYAYKSTHILEQHQLLSDLNSPSNQEYEYTYRINNNYIFTNKEEMEIEMAYKAYATDSDGIPLIPDDEKYKRAIESYLIERLDYKKWRRGELSKDVYVDSKQNSHFAMASAKTSANAPDIPKMEAIRAVWNRLIPDIRAYYDGFKTMNIDERRVR